MKCLFFIPRGQGQGSHRGRLSESPIVYFRLWLRMLFKHSICGDQPGIPDGMPDSTDPLPPKFFANLG